MHSVHSRGVLQPHWTAYGIEFDLSGAEFFGLTESIQDTSLFIERGRLLFIEQSIDAYPFKSDRFVAQSIDLVSPTTHSLPAPPTFLLMFTGLISCSRRKS